MTVFQRLASWIVSGEASGQRTFYTYLIETDGAPERLEVRCEPDDAAAVEAGLRLLGPREFWVTIGRGRGPAVEWLGAWDSFLGEPRWTPEAPVEPFRPAAAAAPLWAAAA